MAYDEKFKRKKIYSYVGFLNGQLTLNPGSTRSTKVHSYVGFLNGQLTLDSETKDTVLEEEKENGQLSLDSETKDTVLEEEKEMCLIRKKTF